MSESAIRAPYPADTRAKGWRFELDHERIESSTTWALAPADLRPWLLMLWMTAWKQTPCGSLESDESVIAARIGMPAKAWAKHRVVLMRGWRLADDGRLYHGVLTELVVEMMGRRRSESDRKARQRGAVLPDSGGSPADVPRDKSGTPSESDTDHRPPTTDHQEGAKAPSAHATPADVCIALKAAGIGKVNPGDQRLRTLVDAGAEVAEFVGFAAKALETAPGGAWGYVMAAVAGERTRAKTLNGAIHHGPLKVVGRQAAIEAEGKRAAAEWLAQQGTA